MINYNHTIFYGFGELFPYSFVSSMDIDLNNSKLSFSELFDTNNSFRNELRLASRLDFFSNNHFITDDNNDNTDKMDYYLLKDLKSAYMSYWKTNKKFNTYGNISAVFSKYNLMNITGDQFIRTLTRLRYIT